MHILGAFMWRSHPIIILLEFALLIGLVVFMGGVLAAMAVGVVGHSLANRRARDTE